MAVDDPRVIDIVSTVRATGEVVLVVADHLPWEDAEHLEVLQAKLNAYLAYIESGQLADAYPAAAPGVPVRIEVACKYPPSALGVRFLEAARDVIVAAGWGFTWVVSPDAEPGVAVDGGRKAGPRS